jgi:uncharacterized integral membrane protein (TIGR00698 family)
MSEYAVAGRKLSDEALLSLDSMEGLYMPPVVEKTKPVGQPKSHAQLTAYSSVLLIAALAYGLHYLPFAPFRVFTEHGFRRPISASILAILIGVCARSFHLAPDSAVEQRKGLVKRFIPVLIVLTGAGLDLTQMASIGAKALAITVACIAVSFAASVYIGRIFGAWRKTSILIGAGTAICGTSAIVAAAPLIDAEDEDITLAVGTVNVLGLALMFCLPLAGGLLRLSDSAFGVWAGTSIHAVPQVVAAGFAYSEQSGSLATLVKLVRVTLLAPFLIVMVLIYSRRAETGAKKFQVKLSRMVPLFLWGFFALAAISTMQMLPTLRFDLAPWMPSGIRSFQIPVASLLVECGNLLLTLVMAAMGLEVDLRSMASVGRPALLTGLFACLALSLFSLLMIRLIL